MAGPAGPTGATGLTGAAGATGATGTADPGDPNLSLQFNNNGVFDGVEEWTNEAAGRVNVTPLGFLTYGLTGDVYASDGLVRVSEPDGEASVLVGQLAGSDWPLIRVTNTSVTLGDFDQGTTLLQGVDVAISAGDDIDVDAADELSLTALGGPALAAPRTALRAFNEAGTPSLYLGWDPAVGASGAYPYVSMRTEWFWAQIGTFGAERTSLSIYDLNLEFEASGLAATEDTCFWFENLAPATALVPVQNAPSKSQLGAGWNGVSSSGANWIESVLVVAGTPVTSRKLFRGLIGPTLMSTPLVLHSDGNILLFGPSTGIGTYGGGLGVLNVANAQAIPTSNPTASGLLYSEAGAGKWRGSSGTVTTFGPAEPHCPTCGRDFATEHKNDDIGEHVAVCIPCMLSSLESAGIDVSKFAFIRQLDNKPNAAKTRKDRSAKIKAEQRVAEKKQAEENERETARVSAAYAESAKQRDTKVRAADRRARR